MSYTDVVNEYIAIIDKLEELRLLLKEKLIQLKVIDNDDLLAANMTFPKLLTKVNPADINSIVNKQLSDLPIDRTTDFVTDFKINGEYNQQYSIEAFNSLLVDKFNFYRKYLMYQLKNMGVNEYEVDQAVTIKNLILLLNKIDKVKTIDSIICNNTVPLIVNEPNSLDITVFDETLIEVEVGTLEIYENGTRIYRGNIGEEIIITPTTIGEHTYSFKYINVVTENNTERTISKYITSELFDITFDVTYPQLEGSFTLQNVTTTSRYYTGNEDDFIGYESDLWDIDVNIFNIHQESINQAIPFNIYMYDEDHLIASGTTDTTGHVKLTNISIPYANSDFIDYRESAVTRFSIDTGMDIQVNRSILSFADKDNSLSDADNPGKAIFNITVYNNGDPVEGEEVSLYINDDESISAGTVDDIFEELSFIKNPTLIDGELTYKRSIFNKNNYLDDLNGCITDIKLVNGMLQYTTFSTSDHTKIEEIEDLVNVVGHFVTEIFYKNNIVTYETVTNKLYQYDKQETNYYVPLILKTQLTDPQYPNAELYHNINIYHIPLRIDDAYLTWYKGDSSVPSSIPIVLYDEETNEPLSYLDQEYTIEVNGVTDTMDSPIYNYEIDISSLPYGDTSLSVILYQNNVELMSLNKTITILSNFELPSKTVYYLTDTPDIYYKPKGVVAQNKQVKINNTIYYTNANGLLHALKDNQTVGTYNLTLIANSDSLTEQRTFSYELKKPFMITRTSYDQYTSATYQITFYDNEHVQWQDGLAMSTPNPNNFIVFKNENNETINYTYSSSYTNNSITYHITINKTSNTVGTNTLTVTVNGYTETTTFEFELYEHLYELVTTEIGLGYWQNIQIKCNDPDVDTVEISGTGISKNKSKPITKTDDILTVNCSITQAAPNGVTVSMSHDDITEVGTLIIPKGNVNGDLYIGSSRVTSFPIGQSTSLYLYAAISFPINTSQTFIVNDGINNYTQNTGGGNGVTASIVNFKNTNRAPGTYTATLTYNGDSNFNSFSTSLTYTITADNCTLTLTPSNDFLDASHTYTTLTAKYTYGDNLPIPNATIYLTIGSIQTGTSSGVPIRISSGSTNSNGIATINIDSVGTYTAFTQDGNNILCVSNTSDIRGVVEESSIHIPQNPIVLSTNRSILSYADKDNTLPDEDNPGKTIITATIYDQHGDKIKNQTVKFYILVEEKTTALSITAPTWIPYVGNNTTATVTGTLTDDNNNILVNKPIKIYINNTLTDTQNTDSNGQVTYIINNCTNFSTVVVKLVYDGDSRYRSSENNTTINVGANVYITGVN